MYWKLGKASYSTKKNMGKGKEQILIGLRVRKRWRDGGQKGEIRRRLVSTLAVFYRKSQSKIDGKAKLF
jgi:hypothetical protein